MVRGSCLNALPTAARKQVVVAKVRLVSHRDQAATVVVVEAIKGVVLNGKIELGTGGSSCTWLDSESRFFNQPQGADAGKSPWPSLYFIAGSWLSTPQPGDSRIFTGAWRGETRMH